MIEYVVELLGLFILFVEDFEMVEMILMVWSFYVEFKKVKNDCIKDEFGVELFYFDYWLGFRVLVVVENG